MGVLYIFSKIPHFCKLGLHGGFVVFLYKTPKKIFQLLFQMSSLNDLHEHIQ